MMDATAKTKLQKQYINEINLKKGDKFENVPFGLRNIVLHSPLIPCMVGAPVAQWVKRWPTDLAD